MHVSSLHLNQRDVAQCRGPKPHSTFDTLLNKAKHSYIHFTSFIYQGFTSGSHLKISYPVLYMCLCNVQTICMAGTEDIWKFWIILIWPRSISPGHQPQCSQNPWESTLPAEGAPMPRLPWQPSCTFPTPALSACPGWRAAAIFHRPWLPIHTLSLHLPIGNFS